MVWLDADVQRESVDEYGRDSNIFFRTCTTELSIPDWRVSATELKERLVTAIHMAEIVGMQAV